MPRLKVKSAMNMSKMKLPCWLMIEESQSQGSRSSTHCFFTTNSECKLGYGDQGAKSTALIPNMGQEPPNCLRHSVASILDLSCFYLIINLDSTFFPTIDSNNGSVCDLLSRP